MQKCRNPHPIQRVPCALGLGLRCLVRRSGRGAASSVLFWSEFGGHGLQTLVHYKMSEILTRRRSRYQNIASNVEEDCGSDLFVSDDDDVADRDYVQPAHVSSSDDEPLSPKKERHKRQRARSLLQPCVPHLPDHELSDKGARNSPRGSRVPAVTRVPQKATTSSVVPVLSDSSHHEQVKKPNKSYYLRDKKNFRWSLELLHTAVCEHRWDDAFRLLPCVITHTVPHLSLEFLWRVTDVITRNVPSLSVNDRKKFRSILHGMKLKTSMFLDILSQDLGEATDRDADELLQMIEDIQNQRQPPAQGIETRTGKRFKALSDGYIGLVHYHRWKSSLLNAMSFSQALDDDSCLVSICESQGTANTSKNEIARTAHWFLKKALSGLIEPCDWFMLQFLELEKELYGQESAISVLERYKSDPCRAPAHHLAYHFYKNLVPGSVMEQLVELECISRACPDDPLVLEEVNLYLHSLEHGGLALDRAMMWMRSAESDSGQESSDECPSPGPTDAFCTLKTTGKVEVLMRCLMLLVAMLDYPAHTWDLQPWQKLTQVLTKFYQAWVRCWFCLACRNTRKRIHRLAMTVVPLWKHFVWKEPPANLPLEQARVLFHHVFVAFIFNYNEEYMSHSLSVLWASGHLQLREELMNLINFPGAFLRHFSLLAKKYRKRVEGISLRFLSQTASQNKRAIQQNQERTQNTSEVATITSSQDLDQETQKEGLHDSECEGDLTQLSPFKDSAIHNILNEETGLSPKSLRNIFEASFEGDFLTSTQTKDERCRDQKKLVENPELNGTYITYQEINNKFASASDALKTKDDHTQSKIRKCESPPNVTSKRKDFGDCTESSDKVDGKQDSIESKKDSESTSVKAKSGTQKESKLPQRKESVPQPAALPTRIRLSNRRLYQSYSKGTTTMSNKTMLDADQNCLPEEGTGTISCLTHRLGSDRSTVDRQSVNCQEETAHEVQGAEDSFLQLEGKEERGSWNEAESTCVENPEKKKLLFDESLSTDTKVTRHDVNITLETSVRNTEDRNECSISSSSSAQNVPDTRTFCHVSELKSDRPEYSASGGDKEKINEKDISTRSDEDSAKYKSDKHEDCKSRKDNTKRSKSEKVKHKLKNCKDNTEEKDKQTPESNTKSVCQHIDKNKYQDLNKSHVKGTIANEDSLRTPNQTRSKNDMKYITVVRETETQSHDEVSDDAFQIVPETQSQMDTSINISTEDRHSDKAQQEEDEVVHRKQNEAVQEKENDKTKGKQNEEVQGKDKSGERQCDETDVGKQTESIREEWKSEEQVLSSIGQGRQGEVTLESLEIDVGSVFNQEYSHSSLSSLTAGQRERGSTSSPDEPAPVSQCGQGFFLTQERESGEVLLSLDGKESGSQKPEHGDIKVITLDELEKLDLEDLDCNLLRRLAEQHYSESIKSEENSSEVQNWHSDKTPDGLLESVSMHQDPKEGSNATTCVTEEETLLEAENWVQVQRKPDEPQQESPSEERCNLQTEVQDSEENSSGSEHKSLKKSLDKIKSTAQKVLEPETVAPKEHGTDSKALPKTTQAFERRIPTNKHDGTLPPQDGQLQTPSTRHPNMPWFMLHVEDLPTPSMQDIIKHSDTSTPITSGKQRHRPSGTPKDTRGSTKHSRVPHYPASWLEGLPLPGTGNNTPSRKSKDIDAHEAKFKIPEGVLSSASVTRKASRKSKKILRDPEVENPDAALSGTSRGKTEKSSRKRKKKVLAYTDEGIIDVKGLEDNISLCGKDREEGAEPGIETSVPIMEEAEMIDSKQESETRNDVCTSVTDGMDDLPIPRDTEAGLEVSPERDTSSMIETDMNILESDGQQCVQDIHYGTDTDELKDLPPNNEDKGDGLEINENVFKNNNHHSVWEDFQHATQAEWFKDLPLPNVLVMSPDRNDTSSLKTKKQHSERRKSSFGVPVMDWMKDLSLHCENRQSKAQRDVTPVPETRYPTLTTSKHQFKSKRRESLLNWTEGLPFDIESILAGLKKPLHEDNTSQVDKAALCTNQSVDEENNEDQSVTGPPSMNDLMYNSEQEEETHETSPHSKKQIDQGKEAPSRKRTRADRISATESNTDITGEGQKPESKKEADRVEKIKKKLKKKKKSSDESPSHSKVTGSSPATTQEESVRGSILSPVMKDVQTTESESVREGECEKGERDCRKEKKKRKTIQEKSEKGSSGMNLRNMRHEECEGETSYYGASEDMKDGGKRKKRKTKQKEYEKQSTDNNQEISGNIRLEEYEEKSSYFSVSEEDPELKARKHVKDSPYKVETVWHSNSDLTVTTSKRKQADSDKRELARHGSRHSKRQKLESSRLGSECSTSSDRNFSITVCNQIEGLSNIRITLSHSPASDSTTSTDKGIKVEVQFSNQNSVTGGAGELCTPVAGQDDSGNLRQSVESPRVPTPHRSPASARKRKLFGDDSSN
ncbi:uncharacterized protein LOC135091650 isoform X2 [Scylla paramamosain]|uniref:uncharacterized protein LOC135091650 isoform X2 n=1 Tax=Scylla paramamosain TaxID=85552 RepID=UPI003083CCBA